MLRSFLILFISLFTVSLNAQYDNAPKPNKSASEWVTYIDWTVGTGGNCHQVKYICAGFNWGVVRSSYKKWCPELNTYAYYYYVYFVSNSTYNGGGWAYTALYNVNFFLDGKLVVSEPYILFKEKKNVCVLYHSTNPRAYINYTWKNIAVY